MKAFWLSLTLTVVSLAGINYSVDPAHQWHPIHFDVKQNWSSDQVWAGPHQLDERFFRAKHLALIDAPDVLFLGSSRVNLVNSAMFSKNVRLYNAGLSGATVQDFVWTWQLLKNLNKIPRHVVLFFDPYILNKNAGQMRWRSNRRWVDEFLEENHSAAPKNGFKNRLHHAIDDANYFRHRAAELVSYQVLLYSLDSLRHRWRHLSDGDEGILVGRNDVLEREGYYFDGSVRYPLTYTLPASVSDARKKVAEETRTSLYSLANWRLDREQVDLLQQLMADMRRHGVKLLLIIPPFPPQVIKDLTDREGYQRVMPDSVRALQPWLNENQEVGFCNDYDSKDPACDEMEFYDAMHPAESCVKKVINACLSSKRAWKPLLASPH